MPMGLVGKKYGMTRVFTEDGVSIPVTVILIENNRVVRVKTPENDGYTAVQVTAGSQLASRLTKPAAGHFAKFDVEAGAGLWEFPVSEKEVEGIASGQSIAIDLFQIGEKVDVSGTSKGKGFAGTIKRHNFRSQDATHGNSLAHRVAGSTGMNQSPGRVFPGKKMAGQMGNVRRTAQNQEVVHIDTNRNLVFIKGAVPGAIGGWVMIKKTVKRA